MATQTPPSTPIDRVVDLARDLHCRLGGGWAPAVYLDGLALLLREAGIATCAGREVAAAPCLARDLVSASGLVIRVAGVERPRHLFAECLARTGLNDGLLLYFGDDQVEAMVVRSTDRVGGCAFEGGEANLALEPSTTRKGRGSRVVA